MLDQYILPSKKIQFRMIDEEAILLDLKDNSIYFLNAVGSAIWNLANGKTRVSNIIDRVFKEFNVDYETAQKDTLDFIKKLSKKGILNLLHDKAKRPPSN